MYPDFEPLFRNSHLATVAANFWCRSIDLGRFPATECRYKVDDSTTVVALEHQPAGSSRAQIVCLHGLEGSADAGYIQSLSQAALCNGYGVHRLNLRTCGGTEDLCETMYHSGLTSDTWSVLRKIATRFGEPIFLIGFSLGGNVALKLAGEYDAASTLSGVCSVSAPLDLAACVHAIDRSSNIFYARRFLNRLKDRIRRKTLLSPHLYSADGLDEVKSIWQFDDRFTAPLFGFGTAAHYYETQSAKNYIGAIDVPTLLITAKDDPLVPFALYENPALKSNSAIQLLAPSHGGHLGFLSRRRPRFWLDVVIIRWIDYVLGFPTIKGTVRQDLASV